MRFFGIGTITPQAYSRNWRLTSSCLRRFCILSILSLISSTFQGRKYKECHFLIGMLWTYIRYFYLLEKVSRHHFYKDGHQKNLQVRFYINQIQTFWKKFMRSSFSGIISSCFNIIVYSTVLACTNSCEIFLLFIALLISMCTWTSVTMQQLWGVCVCAHISISSI